MKLEYISCLLSYSNAWKLEKKVQGKDYWIEIMPVSLLAISLMLTTIIVTGCKEFQLLL